MSCPNDKRHGCTCHDCAAALVAGELARLPSPATPTARRPGGAGSSSPATASAVERKADGTWGDLVPFDEATWWLEPRSNTWFPPFRVAVAEGTACPECGRKAGQDGAAWLSPIGWYRATPAGVTIRPGPVCAVCASEVCPRIAAAPAWVSRHPEVLEHYRGLRARKES
jgi:hypothetical protein